MSRIARGMAVMLLIALSACGGSSPTAPDSGSDTQTMTGTVAAYGTASHSVEAARAGTLVVTLTWSGGADLDLYLSPIECTGYAPDQCLILARSTASTGNQEQIEWAVNAQERYKVWIDNFSPSLSASYTVVATLR